MSYPAWEPCAANGLIIAVVGILHVFVSHFAIGGGLYLVLAETHARRKNNADLLAYVERHSRFFALLTLVFGAVTGVGIWITIGLIHPVGTKWLINNFVWAWGIEWVFFLVEIAAALAYYYGWKRLSPKAHITIGWIYFAAAWLSLFAVNGILAFMLTPGDWVTSGRFWDGFFNPTFWPSTLFRTFICLVLAGLYATFTAAKENNPVVKVMILRGNGALVLGSLILSAPFGLWYFGALPGSISAAFMTEGIALTAVQVMLFSAGLLVILTLLGTIVFPRRAGYVSAAVLLLCALMFLGGFEWAREAARKPYIIYDFLYGNGLRASEAASLPALAPLPVAYSTGNRGRDLYLNACRPCHTYSGYLSLNDKTAGLETGHIANVIPRLQSFLAKMPPFPGNADDAVELARHLAAKADRDPIDAASPLTDAEKADIIFHRRCGICHTMTGPRAIGRTFEGLTVEEAADMVLNIQDLTDLMPPYTGSDDELRLLAAYLTGAVR